MHSLITILRGVSDERSGNAPRHELLDVLTIALTASICGCETWVEFADFGEDREDLFREFLSLKNGLPSHDTLSRLFWLIDPAALLMLYARLDEAVKTLVGHRLFTLLVVVEGGTEVERIYSSDPVAYKLTGRKPMSKTLWGDHVIRGLQPWHGRTMADIRWAFSDHELIESLGCGSCINIPVIVFGRMIGTMNVLDREHAYDDSAVATPSLFVPILTLPFAEAATAIESRS
jgi:hypothetical protein